MVKTLFCGQVFKEVSHECIQEYEIAAGEKSVYSRIFPEIYGASEECYKATMDVYSNGSQEVSQPKIIKISDAIVLGRGVVLNDEFVLKESLTHYARQPELAGLVRNVTDKSWAPKNNIDISRVINDENCVLLKMNSDGNYGHWIVDALPRIELIRRTIGVEKCKFIISYISGSMKSVYFDSLKKMGIAESQILCIPEVPVLIKKLIYPLPMTVHPWVKHPDVFKFSNNLVDINCEISNYSGFKKIFVRRSSSYRRALINESSLACIAAEYGFVEFWPEKASFEEQVAVFSNAKFVIGGIGATVASMIYSPLELVFLGFAPKDMYDDFFWDIVCHKNGRYISLHGESESPGDRNSNYRISTVLFREILERTMGF